MRDGRRRAVAAVALAALAVLAGCTLPGGSDHDTSQNPETDQIGWESGYWYDESISVTREDGFNESERAAVLARTKARVEDIRDLEFDGNVSFEIINRSTYRNRSSGSSVEQNPWNDQVWEALFLVGEDESTNDAFGDTLGESVQGYYETGNDSIVLVSESATPTVDRATLSHELVHALQDQQGALNESEPTQDTQLASQSVTEGEANLVRAIYEERCQRKWDCLQRPQQSGGQGGSGPSNVFLVLYQPYVTGPSFVQNVRSTGGGWDAVSDLYENEPASTEQVIHPQLYPDEEPVNVTVADRSNDEWSRFDHDPVADTVGEASIYVTFLANDVIDPAPENRLSYESKPSAGWAGDSVVPYENGSGGGGYVWRTAWDTDRDARQFAEAYRKLLDRKNAEQVGDGVYVLPESSPYGDAFRLRRNGDRVTVVNAPTRADLDAVHAAS